VRAVESRQLTQQAAERIGSLDLEAKEKIAAAIEQGHDPRETAKPYLEAPRTDLEPWDAAKRIVRTLKGVRREVERVRSGLTGFDASETRMLQSHAELIAGLMELPRRK